MELKIEVLDRKSTGTAALLGQLLVDEYVLAVRTRDARRNINGRNITELRRLFGDNCKFLDAVVLDLSRRVRALGQPTLITFAHSMEASRLKRHNEKFTGQNQIIEALLDDHEFLIRTLTQDISIGSDGTVDAATADFMTGLMGQHLEMAGMLKEWLQ
jgi:starvation-inducible DNA-binding protein